MRDKKGSLRPSDILPEVWNGTTKPEQQRIRRERAEKAKRLRDRADQLLTVALDVEDSNVFELLHQRLTAWTKQFEQGLRDRPPKVLIEIATNKDSSLGRVGARKGMGIFRFTVDNSDVRTKETEDLIMHLLDRYPDADMWASFPCTPWTVIQRLNLTMRSEFKQKLDRMKHDSLIMVRRLRR